MILRASLKTGPLTSIAAILLLLALAGASLGCAYAACYGVDEAPPPAIAAPLAAPHGAAPAAHPMAGVGGHGRCAGSAAVRMRRSGCRAADLPAV